MNNLLKNDEKSIVKLFAKSFKALRSLQVVTKMFKVEKWGQTASFLLNYEHFYILL